MKKVLLFVAVVATIGLASCTNKQAEAEKAAQDSIAQVATQDSIAQAEAAANVPTDTIPATKIQETATTVK